MNCYSFHHYSQDQNACLLWEDTVPTFCLSVCQGLCSVAPSSRAIQQWGSVDRTLPVPQFTASWQEAGEKHRHSLFSVRLVPFDWTYDGLMLVPTKCPVVSILPSMQWLFPHRLWTRPREVGKNLTLKTPAPLPQDPVFRGQIHEARAPLH